jgi:hypothetical protein
VRISGVRLAAVLAAPRPSIAQGSRSSEAHVTGQRGEWQGFTFCRRERKRLLSVAFQVRPYGQQAIV